MWQTKDDYVIAALRGLIADGEWPDGRLPGYRTLEQRLKVGRKAVEKAIARLETEGQVGPAGTGKRRTILRRGKSAGGLVARTLLIVTPHPVHECSPGTRALLAGIFQSAESLDWKVQFHHFDFNSPRRTAQTMKRTVANYNPERIILYSPSAGLQKWALESPIPCFRVGGVNNAHGKNLPGVGVSFGSLVCAAAGRLWAAGHRRLLIPIVSGRDLMRTATLERSAASWAREVPRVELEAMFPFQGEWLPHVLKEFWPRQFARLKPTAVIVKESNEFLSLLSYCNHRNIRIPEDLSVIQLAADPIFSWLDPQPDCFEFPIAAMNQKVAQWLKRRNGREGTFELLEATYQPGGTVKKAGI